MKTIATALLITIALSGNAFAQRIPDYYPDRFQRTGIVDDVQTGTIIVNDIPYSLSPDLVVHSLFERETFITRVLRGNLIGYRFGQSHQIVEIWILPDDYDQSASRRVGIR